MRATPTESTGTRTGLGVAVIAVVAGIAAAFSGASPTGDTTIDAILTVVVVGGATWLGAAALRWDAALISLVAAATAWNLAGAVVATAAAIVGYTFEIARDRRTIVTAVMVGVALNVAARSHLGGFLGLSAIVFVALAVFIGAIGARRRTRAVRRRVATLVATAATLAVVSTAAFGISGLLAAGDLRDANARARSGLEALGDGDIDAARIAFDDAAASFGRADGRTDSPLTAASRVVPGVAQHHRAATELTGAAADTARVLAARLADIDLDALSSESGRIDVETVRSLQQPLLDVEQEIAALQQTITGLDSPWLVAPIADRIDDLAAEVDEQRLRSSDAVAVATAAPELLGGDGPRTYFIGFTTPVEARGLGGFMGNWAEITITDGTIEMTRFGRADDLNNAGDPTTRRFTSSAGTDAAGDGDQHGLDEWLARYGAYSLNSGPGGTTGPAAWKNINMSPDMAATGRAIADLYPQSGGGELDGVFIMDVYTLARLLEFTGPIPLPDGVVIKGQDRITADNATEFLLNDQYDVTEFVERVDLLEDFSIAVVDRLLDSPLPDPVALLDALGPMVDQGRLTGWAARATDQDLFNRLGLAGTLPMLDRERSGDGLAIAFNNASGSKIDYYLDAVADYDVVADAGTNTASAELVLTLTNNAPAAGEPWYVIGSVIGLPDGSNRTWVSIFSRLPVTDVRLDDEPVATETDAEAGYFVTSAFITLGSGESATMSLTLDGRLDVADGYELAVRSPPTVGPTPIRVDATWIDADAHSHRETAELNEPGLARIRVGGQD